ncbi:HsdM family class I SAM-dependent methyltransferase [endosymbiont GvMRE of Glomus versiforme]|uniref:HsdM family class I SAM-dependent methyltransferase n=1 Tax=endosymbiont GvMRE of Glomus versiforme TaxID=2039283 RepID=UPI000ED963F4|nr:N-6 DNA methylase [endosymbiont GvMRE of Glomus versiforme]RHZ37746.1 Type I restriction-modification system, M subunit [endosymbiont GvMRE of Glomus versiforme]
MVFIEKEKWNWHNIIKVCTRLDQWKHKDLFLNRNNTLNHTFKELFLGALIDWPALPNAEKIKAKIQETIKRYRPDQNDWWYPEVIEYFYPRYLATKGGVFFTPRRYCELLSELALLYLPKQENKTLAVYDPACGAGALLYIFRQYQPNCAIYGQEIEHESVLIARWVLLRQFSRFLGGGTIPTKVKTKKGKIKCENTLESTGFKRYFDLVLCNPPFNQLLKKEVHRTKDGNTAWVRQCLQKLQKNGVCLIILPTSILVTEQFKAERKRLVQKNYLEAVFYDFIHKDSSTGNAFDNAQLDTCVLLLRKKRQEKESVYFINCSGKTKEQIMAEFKSENKEKVSRERLKEHDYCFIKYILERLDEPNGVAISNYFRRVSSRNLKDKDKQSLAIKLATKLFEKNREPIAMLVEEMENTCGGVEHWYLISKKKKLNLKEKEENEKRMKMLINYLEKNEPKQRKFYYGAIIKELRIKEFLEWKVLWEEPEKEEENKIDFTQPNMSENLEKSSEQTGLN